MYQRFRIRTRLAVAVAATVLLLAAIAVGTDVAQVTVPPAAKAPVIRYRQETAYMPFGSHVPLIPSDYRVSPFSPESAARFHQRRLAEQDAQVVNQY